MLFALRLLCFLHYSQGKTAMLTAVLYIADITPFIAENTRVDRARGRSIHTSFILISATLTSLSNDRPVLNIEPMYITVINPINPYLGIKSVTSTTRIKESNML